MTNINLLPSDLGPKASVLKIAALVKKVETAALAIFCIFILLTVGYVYYLNAQLTKSNAKQAALQTSIKSLEQTEQKLFLVKDRLAKIRSVQADAGVDQEFADIGKNLIGNVGGVTFKRIDTAPGKAEIVGSAQTSAQLGTFLDLVLTNPLYKKVQLTAFSYIPASGYSFGLEVAVQ
jgi:hypothetical protein